MAAIFGIPIDTLSRAQARARLEQFFDDGAQHLIATPNPEILLAAREDQGLRDALQASSMNMPDGFGLILALKFLGERGERYPGVDIAEDCIRVAAEKNQTVYLLGDSTGSAEKAAMKFPNARIIAEAGPDFRASSDEIAAKSDDIIARINSSGATCVLAAFGHPRQEKWLHHYGAQMPNVKIAIGVGGTFDFWSGKAKRAPSWMRAIGFEWLWRLMREPKRWKRIWNALVLFPVEVMAEYIDGKITKRERL